MTPDPAALLALAERLENAKGPSRGLDGAIAAALFPKAKWPLPVGSQPGSPRDPWPMFTRKLDAVVEALNLRLSEDHQWLIASPDFGEGFYLEDGITSATVFYPRSSGGAPRWKCYAVTPAMALAAALCRALAARPA
jgi:hypothetical protein